MVQNLTFVPKFFDTQISYMKKFLLTALALTAIVICVIAQVPQAVNYQAVARDAGGSILPKHLEQKQVLKIAMVLEIPILDIDQDLVTAAALTILFWATHQVF